MPSCNGRQFGSEALLGSLGVYDEGHEREHIMLLVEFTIEPFVEGSPGAHVTAAVTAVEEHGIMVEFGPFGSSFAVSVDLLPVVTADLMRAAYSNGATYVSLDVGQQPHPGAV
jgi:uncharacterized protein YqgV (UPF0045/DUF77 family)